VKRDRGFPHKNCNENFLIDLSLGVSIASDMYASDMYFVRKVLFQDCLLYVGVATLLTLYCHEHEYMTNDSS
jgi:hypothetical protein